MYDPFRRTRAKAGKRMRRATTSAFSNSMGAMFAPVAPAKRKAPKPATPTKAAKPAARTVSGTAKPAARPGKAAGKGGPRRKSVGASAIPTTPRARTAQPRGASFRSGVHVCDFGTRSFKLYIPAVATNAESTLPLVVMLHGCGQSPEDFARGTGMNVLAEEFGFMVLYPAQERRTQLYRCWNWYKPGDQARGAGEPALLASLVRQIVVDNAADPARIYVAGLSAGASAALIVAEAYPDIFAAVGAHSGLSVGAACDEASAVFAMRNGLPGRSHSEPMPTISFHGSADRVVNPRNGRFLVLRALQPYIGLRRTEKTGRATGGGRQYVRTSHRLGKGRSFVEHWVIVDSGHAWSGGNAAGSYTDPAGPDASREMVRFFLRHRTTLKRRSTPRE